MGRRIKRVVEAGAAIAFDEDDQHVAAGEAVEEAGRAGEGILRGLGTEAGEIGACRCIGLEAIGHEPACRDRQRRAQRKRAGDRGAHGDDRQRGRRQRDRAMQQAGKATARPPERGGEASDGERGGGERGERQRRTERREAEADAGFDKVKIDRRIEGPGEGEAGADIGESQEGDEDKHGGERHSQQRRGDRMAGEGGEQKQDRRQFQRQPQQGSPGEAAGRIRRDQHQLKEQRREDEGDDTAPTRTCRRHGRRLRASQTISIAKDQPSANVAATARRVAGAPVTTGALSAMSAAI